MKYGGKNVKEIRGEDLKTNLSTLRFFEIFVTLICTIVGLIFSVSIEMLQLLLRLGTFQVSDIVYNTLGGMLGGLCYIVGKKVHERLSK